MAKYYKTHTKATPIVPSMNTSSATSTSADAMSEFDKHCETLLSDNLEEGWASEPGCYLNMMQWDVKKDMDIVEWWQVCIVVCPLMSCPYFCPQILHSCQGFTGRTPAWVQDGSLPKGLNEFPAQLPHLGQLWTHIGSKSLVMQDC